MSSEQNQLVAQSQKILQLCHHLSLIGPPGAEIVLPGAFQKIKGDLLELFSPANPTDDIAFRLLRTTRCYFGNIIATFRGHYYHSIITLAKTIGSKRVNPWKLREANQRADLNFRHRHRKVSKTATQMHQRIMSFISRNDLHGLRNFLNSLLGKSFHLSHTHTQHNSHRDFQVPNKTTHNKNQTHNTPTTLTNRFTPLSNQTQTHTPRETYDPKLGKINIQGANHPLSNFYPCRMKFKNVSYPSAEHAYQHTKATFCSNKHAAAAILQAPNAYVAKSIGNSTNKQCTNKHKIGISTN